MAEHNVQLEVERCPQTDGSSSHQRIFPGACENGSLASRYMVKCTCARAPDFLAVHYGWFMNTGLNILEPEGLPPDVSPAPVDILKMIKCGCASSHPCSSPRCGCSSVCLSCSEFCSCQSNDDSYLCLILPCL